MRTPEFWQGNGLLAHLLEPLGFLYGVATAWRLAWGRSWQAPVPVICIGNLVVGGAGKTPVALAVAQRLSRRGIQPTFLTRGYSGSARGPLQVLPERDKAERVGDEALLLAAEAPTVIARRRVDGARLAVAAGAQIIVMDDGHQNPTVHKDVALVVVDGAYGFGNNRLLPAGPLRESVKRGLTRASALVVLGEDRCGVAIHSSLPVLQAHLMPGPEAALLAGQRVVAFAGIGRPEKFFATLQAIGAHLIACHPFADHMSYAAIDIQPILDEACALQAIPVTTVKDTVRLFPHQRQQVTTLTVTLRWHDVTALDAVLAPAIQNLHIHEGLVLDS